jgi:3-oxoacyl-[acyl-carrier protein] reductase
MDLKLNGKIAMVAASSKGLGFGIALELAKEGAKLSIGSRTKSDIMEAGKRIEDETGTDVLASVLDSSDANSIKNWIDLSLDRFGGIDCLVVNAGGPPPGVFENFSDNDWQSAFDLKNFQKHLEVVLLHLQPDNRYLRSDLKIGLSNSLLN